MDEYVVMAVLQGVTAIGYGAIAAFLRPPAQTDDRSRRWNQIVSLLWICFFAFCAATHFELLAHTLRAYLGQRDRGRWAVARAACGRAATRVRQGFVLRGIDSPRGTDDRYGNADRGGQAALL